MPRTNDDLVRGILDFDEDADTAPFIETANALVTSVCSTKLAADGVTPYYSDARLELIERWLAAHFCCVFEPRTIRERINILSEQTESKVDLGLSVTKYGQQAMILDEKGGLAALNAQVVKNKGTIQAGIKWAGRRYEDIPTGV